MDFDSCALPSIVSGTLKTHCLNYRYEVEDSTILVGTNHLLRGGQHYKVQKFISHEDFHYGIAHDNDIGMIRVKGTINFGALVQTIKLSKSHRIPFRN